MVAGFSLFCCRAFPMLYQIGVNCLAQGGDSDFVHRFLVLNRRYCNKFFTVPELKVNVECNYDNSISYCFESWLNWLQI